MFEELSTSGIIQKDSTALLADKVTFLHNPVVYKRKNKSICHAGAKFFHYIQSKRGSAGAISVQKACIRIQSMGFQRRSAVMSQHTVRKREQCIYRIQRGTAVSPGKTEGIAAVQY